MHDVTIINHLCGFSGGGEGEAAAPQVHVTGAAEGNQEGAGHGER